MRIVLLDRLERNGWRNCRNRFEAIVKPLMEDEHEVFVLDGSRQGNAAGLSVLTALNRAVAAAPMVESARAAYRLAEMHPDLVIAPLHGGVAQGVLMARACGEAFAATRVALWCDAPSRRRFLRSGDLRAGLRPLIADALERQCLALADALILPDEPPEEMFLQPRPRAIARFSAALPPYRADRTEAKLSAEPIEEIVFIGPLQRSSGISEFIEAIERLSRNGLLADRIVTFAGPARAFAQGISKEWLGLRAVRWPFQFRVLETEDCEQVWQYCQRPGRLAVGVADDKDGLGFIRSFSAHHVALLRPPTADDALTNHLETELRTALAGRLPPASDDADIFDNWRSLVRKIQMPGSPTVTIPSSTGLTVCVLHHDRLGLLGEALASIPRDVEGQPVEVLVIDNASGIPAVQDKIRHLAGGRPLVRVIELTQPASQAAAYNRGLAEARFETVLFLDDDNILAPTGAERLAGALASGGFDIVVTALDIFDDGSRKSEKDGERLIFLGAAHSAGLFFNAFGDTAMAVRRDAFRSIGGFHDPGYLYTCLDWVTLAKAQAAGLNIGALQWPAVRYRRNTTRADTAAHKIDQEGARSFVFEAYAGAFDAELVARYAQKLQLSEP